MTVEVEKQEPGIDKESTIIRNDKTILSVLGCLLVLRLYQAYDAVITLIMILWVVIQILKESLGLPLEILKEWKHVHMESNI